jgi:hypothetical protein
MDHGRIGCGMGFVAVPDARNGDARFEPSGNCVEAEAVEVLIRNDERVMIHIFAEVTDQNAREKHPRRAEADAAKLDAAQRHAQHAYEGEHANSEGDRLGLVQLEEPSHRVRPQAQRLSPRRSRPRRRSRSSC